MTEMTEMTEAGERTVGSKITDEGLAELRATMNVERPLPQYNRVISEDAVAHYVLGIGDDNPRWLDSAYAARTRWGGMIAPPTFVMSCGFARSRGLAGVHGLFSGIDLHCHQPLKAGSRIVARTALHDLIEHQGRYAGREFQQVSVTRYRDGNGELLSTLYSHAFRTERTQGAKGGKYSSLQRQHYTDEDYARFEAQHATELKARRGSETRYFEDVTVGEPIPMLLKGPLTVTDCIAFLMGFGYIYIKSHRQWNDFRLRHPGAGIKDNYGVWDIPERVHWEEDLPKEIGMPTAYDYGPQRIAWFDNAVCDWMSDDGWLRRLQVSLRAPNFIGDCTWIKGNVKSKNEGDNSVEVELKAEDQRGRVTATGMAEVVLPRR